MKHVHGGVAARGWESTYCSELIKLPKEFIEQFDQFLSSALRSQAGETHNVCKQDAVRRERKTNYNLMQRVQLVLTAA